MNLRYVVCINTGGYVDLELSKVYRVKQDADGRKHGLLRIVDASGEDYLYPKDFFLPIAASQKLFKILEASA